LLLLCRSIIADIRERARSTRALHQAQREAQRATQAKSESLAVMSHEIPDLSKIEAGRLKLKRTAMSVATVVEGCCGLLNRLAERQGGSLSVFVDPAIPVSVLGDPARLRQVLMNLASNGIKFSSGLSRPGRVSVRALLAERHPGHVMVEFRVTDNGIGIDEATLPKLFTSFTQADTSTTRTDGGTGLGLTIAEQLTGLMDGSITVQSAPDLGSTFTVRLSLPVAALSPDTAPDDPAIIGLKCLAIGGPDTGVEDIAAYLMADGASVARVPDLSAAADWMREHASNLTVWVLDAGDEYPPVQELKTVIGTHALSATEVVIVLIGRARRGNLEADTDGLSFVDGNALTRRRLATAVAVVAGRAVADPQVVREVLRAFTASASTLEHAGASFDIARLGALRVRFEEEMAAVEQCLQGLDAGEFSMAPRA
jgi:two-component system, sensor histidine kinase and response regulator